MTQQSHSSEKISREKHGSKGDMYPNVHFITVYSSQSIETIKMSIDKWTDKEDVVHTWVHIYNGILLSHKKRNNAICRNMDGPRDYIQISDRERQISYYFTYMQNLKKWYKRFCLQNRNRHTDLEKELGVAGGEGWWREGLGMALFAPSIWED